MENNIFDFSEFKRKKEEPLSKEIKEESGSENIRDKKLERDSFSEFQRLMGMAGQGPDAGATEKLVSDGVLTLQLRASPNGRAIDKVRSFVRPQSAAYLDAYGRASNLSLEEIRGQIESATESLIKSHPTWYVVLMDNLKRRSKFK